MLLVENFLKKFGWRNLEIIQKSLLSGLIMFLADLDLSRNFDETFTMISGDTTYFLSVPPERYENAIINLKEAGFLDDPDHSRVVIEKPFGYDL